MALPKREIDGSTVVLLGNLNPAIFQPSWFARHGLVSEQDAEAAEIAIIRPEVTQFKAGPLEVQVTTERFQVGTVSAEGLGPLRDLVKGAFTVLHQTPIKKAGFNRNMHFKMGSEEDWHTVGDVLVPKDMWTDLLNQPGMENVTVRGTRTDSPATLIRIIVQPSVRIQPGVFVGVNEHFDLDEDHGLERLLELLSTTWERSHRFAAKAAERLLERCLQEGAQ